jgi:23S rRNA (pseudouridine1915-N3)-methyltransferase
MPAELITVKGEKIEDPRSAAVALRKEAERLTQRTPPGYTRVALTPDAKGMTSEALASWLADQELRATPGIAFLVGSAYGLDLTLIRDADRRLSLSPMTLPHQLAVTVLAEQLYRATTILTGAPYHK